MKSLHHVSFTFSTFFQLLCFSFSKIKFKIRCYFSLHRTGGTNCKRHWRFRVATGWKPANFIRLLLLLAFRPTHQFGIWTYFVRNHIQEGGCVQKFIDHFVIIIHTKYWKFKNHQNPTSKKSSFPSLILKIS
jgi:hypothetical protein